MGFIESLVVFVVSLLIGGAGIYVGASVIVDTKDYERALVTAAIGAIVWSVTDFFLGWIPLLGAILTLLAYVAVVNWRYPGGWVKAAGIALVAWLASLVVVALLSLLGLGSLSAVGVPGA